MSLLVVYLIGGTCCLYRDHTVKLLVLHYINAYGPFLFGYYLLVMYIRRRNIRHTTENRCFAWQSIVSRVVVLLWYRNPSATVSSLTAFHVLCPSLVIMQHAMLIFLSFRDKGPHKPARRRRFVTSFVTSSWGYESSNEISPSILLGWQRVAEMTRIPLPLLSPTTYYIAKSALRQ
jgi:hypothetical protein